jgi:multidrug efflux pump subunit AcrA (membrane-fusion protein)
MMPTRRMTYWFYCLLGGIGLSVIACNNSPATIEDEAPVITPVTIVPVSYKPMTENIYLPAVTAFINKSIVRSTTTGTIDAVSINLGDKVNAGQLLYTIRTREASALNNSLKGDSALSFTGLIKIPASGAGIISTVSHQKGDFVQEGDELAVISDQNSLVFILDTPFEFVKYVEKNGRCKIQLPDKQVIDGSITGRLAEMDPLAQTVRYMIRPLFQGQLPANLNAVVNIIKNTRNNAAVLPRDAVLSDETQTEFWIMKLLNDSIAIKVPVTKGFENNEEVEITDPEFLKTDRIVLEGGYGLPDTARIKIK